MKTKKITTSREKFYSAVLNALNVCQIYPDTKIAYWCNRFLELNKIPVKAHEKLEKKLLRPVKNEFRDFSIDHALEKDQILVLNKDTKEYEPKDKSSKKLIEDKRIECDEKVEELLEPFLEESVECRIFLDRVVLPENFSIRMDNYLNGFAYTNVSEFEESIEDVEEKEA